jgi:glycosyltransferase involved in cell wall biosynthesis
MRRSWLVAPRLKQEITGMSIGVAMVINVFPPSIGGAQTHTLRACQELKQLGVPALVVTRHHPGLARYEELGGVPTYRVGRSSRLKALAALSYILGALQVLIAQRRRYDVLHCHQMVSPMTIGLLGRLLLRKPVVVNPHRSGSIGDIGVLTLRRPISGRLRIAAARRWSGAFVSISRDVHQELRGAGIAEAKIWDISNGVSLDHFHPLAAEQRTALRARLGLPSGRLSYAKGLDVLLDSWARVLQAVPDAQLALVGAGDEQAALEAQAQTRGIRERVHFMGGQADVTPFLQTADVFVLPSRTEGLPVALLEAMACQLPCVATAVGGNVDVLRDAVNGRLTPSEDAVALAHALIDALTNPAAAAWGEQARLHITQHCSLRAVAERYIEMYTTLLTARRGRPILADPQASIDS